MEMGRARSHSRSQSLDACWDDMGRREQTKKSVRATTKCRNDTKKNKRKPMDQNKEVQEIPKKCKECLRNVKKPRK